MAPQTKPASDIRPGEHFVYNELEWTCKKTRWQGKSNRRNACVAILVTEGRMTYELILHKHEEVAVIPERTAQ